MSKSKYIGKVYGVWWEVVECTTYKKNSRFYTKYTLANKANGQRLTVQFNTLRKIELGETTISKVMHTKIRQKKM